MIYKKWQLGEIRRIADQILHGSNCCRRSRLKAADGIYESAKMPRYASTFIRYLSYAKDAKRCNILGSHGCMHCKWLGGIAESYLALR